MQYKGSFVLQLLAALSEERSPRFLRRFRPAWSVSKKPSVLIISPRSIRPAILAEAIATAAPTHTFSRGPKSLSVASWPIFLKADAANGALAPPAIAPTGPALRNPIAAPIAPPAISLPELIKAFSFLLSPLSFVIVFTQVKNGLLDSGSLPRSSRFSQTPPMRTSTALTTSSPCSPTFPMRCKPARRTAAINRVARTTPPHTRIIGLSRDTAG